MAKKGKEPEKDASERWLLTYSDLMNLLLILFIIFYSMSQVDKAKAEKVAESIRSGFGYVENGGSGEVSGEGSGLYGADFTTDGAEMTPGGAGATDAAASASDAAASASDAAASASGLSTDAYWSQLQKQAFEKFYNEVVSLLDQNNLQDMVDVKLDDTGVVISFKDNALFPSGQAELGPASLSLIDKIGTLLKTLDFSWILVEGHTDTDPIHTSQYIDNMDLSTQRATNVWRELKNLGLDPDKMASIGYGEFRPVVPNDSPVNKAKNRRVVITIMRNKLIATGELVSGSGGASPTINPVPSAAASPDSYGGAVTPDTTVSPVADSAAVSDATPPG